MIMWWNKINELSFISSCAIQYAETSNYNTRDFLSLVKVTHSNSSSSMNYSTRKFCRLLNYLHNPYISWNHSYPLFAARCLWLLWECNKCFSTRKYILFHKLDYRNFGCLAISYYRMHRVKSFASCCFKFTPYLSTLTNSNNIYHGEYISESHNTCTMVDLTVIF